MNGTDLLERLMYVIALVLSLSVHEWAHAATAVYLGDDTPIRQGRYTLNPLAHVDPVGTLLLPLLKVPFGWAKPVQWTPSRIRRDVPMQRALWMVSIAGPLSNFLIASLAVIVYVLGIRFVPDFQTSPAAPLLGVFFTMNVGLFVFNLLPIPPLDGSRIVDANVDGRNELWSNVHRYAPFILLAVILIPPLRDGLGSLIGMVRETMFEVAIRITGG